MKKHGSVPANEPLAPAAPDAGSTAVARDMSVIEGTGKRPSVLSKLVTACLPPNGQDVGETLGIPYKSYTAAAGDEILPSSRGAHPSAGTLIAIREGLAIRYRLTHSGDRRILYFLLPGDLCNANPFGTRSMDYSVAAVTPVVLERVLETDLGDRFAPSALLFRALWTSMEREETDMRTRMISLEQHDALIRVAVMLHELVVRLRRIGRADLPVRLPLTQTILAEAVGLTAVHVNRVLQRLRSLEVLTTERGAILIVDTEHLAELART